MNICAVEKIKKDLLLNFTFSSAASFCLYNPAALAHFHGEKLFPLLVLLAVLSAVICSPAWRLEKWACEQQITGSNFPTIWEKIWVGWNEWIMFFPSPRQNVHPRHFLGVCIDSDTKQTRHPRTDDSLREILHTDDRLYSPHTFIR